LKISIITVTYNSAGTVEDTIRSVLSQDHPDLEYIVVDGGSSDGTLSVIEKYRDRITAVVSEPDQGAYDAMNKGIGLASGEVIGILHSDDVYAHSGAISRIAGAFQKYQTDTVFGDLVLVKRGDTSKITRYYRAANFSVKSLACGRMPPHPAFFVKKSCYDRYGTFKTDYKIAADFDLVARFFHVHGLTYHYLPGVLVKMRTGGMSTRSLKSNIILNQEILRACRDNGIGTNIFKIYSKYLTKIGQMFRRPK
jgi:glycosyltransferase involved in cell wall biosynthesis